MHKVLYLWSLLQIFLHASSPVLVFYCGTTMVPAMEILTKKFSQKHHCTFSIRQGASGELLKTLKLARHGDLFLPGSESFYRKEDAPLFSYRRFVGYNRLALFVSRKNPKQIRTLQDLMKKGNYFLLGDPLMGSVGRATKKLYLRLGGTEAWHKAQARAVLFGSDSTDLLRLQKEYSCDAAINWKAAAYRPDYRGMFTPLKIPEAEAERKRLFLSRLSFSNHPVLGKLFIDYVASEEGRKIMNAYGLDDE